jgi:hypothetical protein
MVFLFDDFREFQALKLAKLGLQAKGIALNFSFKLPKEWP